MEKRFLDKVEDNMAVRIWSEKTQQEKGDSLTEDKSSNGSQPGLNKKGDSKCIYWKSSQDLILTHPDMNKIVDVFVLSIYELVISPKALGHINGAVSDLFDWLDKRVTQRLAQCEFAYKGDNYKKKPTEEHLQVIPSELKIIKQDFEKRSSELGKRIKNLEEEKIQLGLDADV
ncbi:hypothetical protein Golob_026597 [Gossypium lobatum]|uniref:Uncharacterized protein n=3 Tax=Gossypium TaxID=3633 RepID=A0A7J8LW19_9ROSI|nr:hypothetical protein [Gossypium lobatum]